MGADCLDAVIDLAAALENKQQPEQLAPHCDSADLLHHGALGVFSVINHESVVRKFYLYFGGIGYIINIQSKNRGAC